MGYAGVKRECFKPTAGDADLWIKIWEELHKLAASDMAVDVEHVKAHRTKKEKNEMSHIENFVTEGNEKADDLARAGAMLDEGFMAEERERESKDNAAGVRRGVRCLAVCSQLSQLGGGMDRFLKNSSWSRKKS